MSVAYAHFFTHAWRIGHGYGRLRALGPHPIRVASAVVVTANKVCINWTREREARFGGKRLDSEIPQECVFKNL